MTELLIVLMGLAIVFEGLLIAWLLGRLADLHYALVSETAWADKYCRLYEAATREMEQREQETVRGEVTR